MLPVTVGCKAAWDSVPYPGSVSFSAPAFGQMVCIELQLRKYQLLAECPWEFTNQKAQPMEQRVEFKIHAYVASTVTGYKS